MTKLRLLLFEDCNRKCDGCCNNDWDLKSLPVIKTFKDYTEILLTGGEPLLKNWVVVNIIMRIRQETNVPIYMYTAKTDNINIFLNILSLLNGVTLTLHNQSDVIPFLKLNNILKYVKNKSLRLNIFKGIDIDKSKLTNWVIKDEMEWIKSCPLPENEHFGRL